MKKPFCLLACFAAALLGGPLAASPASDEAQALIRQGKLPEARQLLEKAVAGAPQDVEARFLHGVLLIRMGDTAAALPVFTALAQDHPRLPEVQNNLAALYAHQGDYKRAADALAAALAANPNFGTAHENLGDLHAALASASYKRAAGLDPANADAKAKLQVLEKFGPLAQKATVGLGTVPPPRASPPPAVASVPPPPQAQGFAAHDEVLAFVRSWADAWSRKDADAYLAHYAREFNPRGPVSRSRWERERRERLARGGSISVEIADPRVEIRSPEAARVAFFQKYAADDYRDETSKVLALVKRDGAWRIAREDVIAPP